MSAVASVTPKYRPLKFGVTRITLRDGAPGVEYVQADLSLQPYAARITDRFVHWARTAPERSFMARRQQLPDGRTGGWQHLSYARALQAARSIAQALLNRGLSAERPVAILSENRTAAGVGVRVCSCGVVRCARWSPAPTIGGQGDDKPTRVPATRRPGLVFATAASRYGEAIAATVDANSEVVIASPPHTSLGPRATTEFAALIHTPATSAADAAMQATGPDTIVKFLFTSGSTKLPKAVINTQRMWCANQQQMAQSMPVLAEEQLVLVDWLPWNHTFGGNHNFGMVLYHGGTLYIDDGKPTPALMRETLRNLREIAPTVYFNVPTGFEAIAHAMKTDDQLRRTLLSRVRMFFYAGAALA